MMYRSQLWTHTWLYYNQQSESERDTLYLRNYMYYKNRYQLQNGKADGHWGSYCADPYPSERDCVLEFEWLQLCLGQRRHTF